MLVMPPGASHLLLDKVGGTCVDPSDTDGVLGGEGSEDGCAVALEGRKCLEVGLDACTAAGV